jgi:hypothetical protein
VRKPTVGEAVTLGVAVLVGLSVARFAAPNYTIESSYSDHLQHEYSSWAFLHIGFRIFDTPREDWVVHAKHVHLLWPQLPTIYPPGLVLFFVPFGVVSNESVLPDPRVHMLMVMILGAAAVLAAGQLSRTLRQTYEPSLAVVLTFLGAVLFVTWGLNGFIDPLASGLALLGIYWARQAAYGRGLVALSVALSLQFRLWYLWPFVLGFAWRNRRAIARWQVVVSATLAVVSLVAFALAVPYVRKLGTIPGIEPNYLALTNGITTERAVAFVLGIAVAAIVFVTEKRPEVAACVVLVLVLIFFVEQWQAWYPVLLIPLIAILKSRVAQAAVTIAILEAVFYLGGFPNVIRTAHLYIDAIR